MAERYRSGCRLRRRYAHAPEKRMQWNLNSGAKWAIIFSRSNGMIFLRL